MNEEVSSYIELTMYTRVVINTMVGQNNGNTF